MLEGTPRLYYFDVDIANRLPQFKRTVCIEDLFTKKTWDNMGDATMQGVEYISLEGMKYFSLVGPWMLDRRVLAVCAVTQRLICKGCRFGAVVGLMSLIESTTLLNSHIG